MRFIQLFALLFLSAATLFAAENKELRILRVTPEGEDVIVGRQIVIQFNRSVVPIGKMERAQSEIPVEISPKLDCEWRWLNTSALSCNLSEKNQFKIATNYKVTIKPGIKAEDGQTTSGVFNHEFTTKRPDVQYAWFYKWLSPSKPMVRVTFDQFVTKESVEKTLRFVVDESESFEVEVDADPSNKEVRKVNGDEARTNWVVTSKKEFALNQKVVLKLGAGLESEGGAQKGIEERELLHLQTFPEFSFLGIKCYTNENDDRTILISPDKPETQKLCNPMKGAALAFSSPVKRSQIKNHVIFNPKLDIDAEQNLWGEGDEEYSQLESQYRGEGSTYDVWLPGGLKAASEYSLKSSSKNIFVKVWSWFKSLFSSQTVGLSDEFGRQLQSQINISFKTDDRKPNFEMPYKDAVMESGIDSEVPIYVNNLSKTTFTYRRIVSGAASNNLSSTLEIGGKRNVQFAVPLKVRDMLGGKSGAVYGFLNSDPIVQMPNRERRLFAQVTPYQVHVKLGHFNSLVWVSDLTTGQAVAGAKVTIYKDRLTELSANKPALAQALTASDGTAILDGLEKLDPNLDLTRKWEDGDERLFVRVDKDGEMALMPINQDFVIDSYRSVGEGVYSESKKRYGHIKAWGTTSQGIYRAGDTISYKLYVRNQDNKSLVPAPVGKYNLQIIDPTDNVVTEVKDFSLNAFGAFSGEFTVPQQGAIGWYQFRLTTPNSPDQEWTPIRVLVSDFTPSSFKVTNQANGDLFRAGQEVEISTQAKLHSGGPYTDANVRLTAMLESKSFASKNSIARDFNFDSFVGENEDEQVFQKINQLNNKGENSLKFKLPKKNIFYGRLMFESAVQDDRGKYVTSQAYANYAGVDRFVGLKTNSWIFESGKVANVDYLVVDERGNPALGTKVNLLIERQETKTTKVKGAGNAYLNEFVSKWVKVDVCEGESQKIAASCKFTPKDAGYYRVTAKISDTKGNAHSTDVNMYVTGLGRVLWDDSSDDSALTIVPEKPTYKVGDKARYLVKNPYPGAKALVTIERYGVIDSFVQTLEGSTPIIEFKVKPDYVPGFYLSVVVFSPRANKPVENQVDLGKPAFRIGYVNVPISDKVKEMAVTAKADRDTYKPREKVKLSIHAEPRLKNKKEPIEFAVVVLDESVFDLVARGKKYFDPYQGFYNLEGLDLRNYSLMTRLIGRQKFEKKGANAGGDGGADISMRNLFKFVSYWNPSLAADASGNANVEFEAPDNLTGWRVLVLAVTPSDRLGLGEANFKVNKPTEIRPVMPNQVIEGDSFDAVFSIMNRTDKKRNVSVIVTASSGEPAVKKQLDLEPYKRTLVKMPMQTKLAGKITFRAVAKDEIDGDAMEQVLTVNKRLSLETSANYATTTEDKAEESIKFPMKIRTDVGGVSIVASASVIGNMDSAFKYLRDYPYLCWEQRITKAVMASRYLGLKSYVQKDFQWPEADKLPAETLKNAANFQSANGGMTYFVAQDQYVDPYLSAYTALAFNWLKKSGYKVPTEVENKLHAYLDNFLKQENSPDFYIRGMTSSVRAVALAALAENNKISLADLERYRGRLPEMNLFGKAYFVQAAMKVNGGGSFALDASRMILANSNQSGGKFTFNQESTDGYSRILSSPMRDSCAVLSTFSELGRRPEGKDLVGEVPHKLVRAITAGKFENTQENVFCLNGLFDYARAYESVAPNMKVEVALDGKKFGETKFFDVKDAPVTFVKNIEASDVGKSVKAAISRIGAGRLYYSTRLTFSSLDDRATATNAGIEIKREYSVERQGKWVLLKSPSEIKKSEVVRVDIFVSLPTARNFVVVNDPVPGGLEPINRDIATASIVDAKKADFKAAAGSRWFKFSNWNLFGEGFYHKELRNESVRFYSEYLEAGNYHLSYVAQAIAAGNFVAMPVMAEEMYEPDVFGKGVTERFKINSGAQ